VSEIQNQNFKIKIYFSKNLFQKIISQSQHLHIFGQFFLFSGTIFFFQKWQLGTVFLPDSFGYLIGTNFFAVPALKHGRYRVAMVALFIVAVSTACVRYVKN
jgi:hypothetical protein